MLFQTAHIASKFEPIAAIFCTSILVLVGYGLYERCKLQCLPVVLVGVALAGLAEIVFVMAQACVLSDVVFVGDDNHTTQLGNLFFLLVLVALAVPKNLNININNQLLFFGLAMRAFGVSSVTGWKLFLCARCVVR
ncbi:hypothetical protein HLB35_05615 [Halomonas sp. TBZ9]|uniref:Uncharacterized protein n=1 Tax=Vreelandella azerica TaxID=2732867 RepID=A0A7Y3TW68_9GAMM|nr:hypothetical protein [Halomonas azerica]NOG31376.1 hypothetical protein [Halomonas azerica]